MMQYKLKGIKELDDATDYPLLVLSGMTGLGQQTILQLASEQKFPLIEQGGEPRINGKAFRDWAESVGQMVEVES